MRILEAPKNVGIKGIEIYFPSQCVLQEELEKHDGVSTGKYTIGLGLTMMGFCDDREDIYSICLTTVWRLIKNYRINVNNIGRLEVGTETLIDKSKSIKTVLMQLFSPNFDIEGIDNINACYGGTNALFNAVNWVQSENWDGRDAIVVAGDIALYSKGAARPTGGAGCVAMIIGKDAPIVIDSGLRGSYMDHVYDFYKPDLSSEYPIVDGHYSIICYTRALDHSYKAYNKRYSLRKDLGDTDCNSVHSLSIDRFDYCIFHSPTCKSVQKAYARMLYNDFMDNENHPEFENVKHFSKLEYESSLVDKNLEKQFMDLSKKRFQSRVSVTLDMSTNVGNMYTASLYGCLVSLLSNVSSSDLIGKRIGAYSYGSGLASTFFSFTIHDDISYIAKILNLKEKLKNRRVLSPEEFEHMIFLREKAYLSKAYIPQGDVSNIAPNAYYLVKIDDKYRREYAFKSDSVENVL
ncbi:unnamed protein product [Pneumocystis jirovecii]|uniref:Hydroxymethylglutaryl-CoA synthase n=2 Tax=Pneumocystis jirovecii TaxID=42068 RepID=L0PC82_PNEJI|nr:hydroxymethylglutaryl-CoA synthase [Pneumocystis jirovecii RU7]KTW29149.1 hydroxymethylglutaryl-CoA synthase [Pneumocystis jirovecii RU7]CCJ29245.1 unnamed protein product [Pneumocystis jirovecii]